MTDFELLISKYIDVERYYRTAGYYHVATRASEIETRKLIDEITKREGYGGGMREHKDYNRTTYATDDRKNVAYAIPRRYYHEKDGNVEVNKVEVVWYTYDLVNEIPTNETETIVPITDAEKSRLIELTNLARDARNGFEAVKRTAVSNLFEEKGIKDDDDKNLKQKLTALRELADGLVEAVTMQDAERLQEIQYDQILALEGIDDDTRKELIRLFSTQHYDGDLASKIPQLACVYANFAQNIVTAIPESYVHDKTVIYQGRVKIRDDEEETKRFTLLRNCLDDNRKQVYELADKWFYEVGGDYVKYDEEKPAEEEEKALQHFAESEAVIQDYTSPKQQIYSLTKASKIIFDDPNMADEITLLDNGQFQFKFAVSRADAKIQRAVIMDIADKVKGITTFDKSVINAVYSVIEAGNTTFTSKQVAIQNTQNEKPRPNTVGAYTKSIEKMRAIIHNIDATEHYEQNGINLEELGVKGVGLSGYLLPVEGITITMNNGTKVNGYRLIKPPILLEYAKNVKQIHTVDNEVLNVPVRLDETTLLIRDYLIQQIGIIYNTHSTVSNNILISTVLDYAGVDLVKLDRTQKKRLTDKITLMLKYWNGEHIDGVQPINNKYIEHGYRLNLKGRSLESITINPRPKAKKK